MLTDKALEETTTDSAQINVSICMHNIRDYAIYTHIHCIMNLIAFIRIINPCTHRRMQLVWMTRLWLMVTLLQ